MIPMRRIAYWIGARSARERWLIVGSIAAVLILLGDQLVLQPLTESRQQATGEMRALTTTVRAQEEEMARLRVALAQNPNEAPRRELDRLEREIAAFDREIAEVTSQLIEPHEMAGVLEAMLARVDDLRLLNLENIAPEPLDDTPGEGDATGAYRHGLRLELEGHFQEALTYLQLLEQLPWGFFWERLEIVTERYPQNRVTFEIYTVTVGEEWLGV